MQFQIELREVASLYRDALFCEASLVIKGVRLLVAVDRNMVEAVKKLEAAWLATVDQAGPEFTSALEAARYDYCPRCKDFPCGCSPEFLL